MPVRVATLVALLVEAVLYGAYSVLLTLCLWIIIRGTALPRLILFAACASFLLSSTYLFFDILLITHAAASSASEPAVTIYTSKRLSIAMNFILVLNAVLGEIILIWRCFHIWNRSHLSIAPSSILLLLMSVSGFMCVLEPNMTIFPKLVYIGLASAISTHLLTTTLLAFKISSFIRSTVRAFGDQAQYQDYYQRIFVIVLITGIIYTVGGIIIIALYASLSPGLMILLSFASQIVGIIPTLMILGTAFAQSRKVATVHRSLVKSSDTGVVIGWKTDCEVESPSSQGTHSPAESDLSDFKVWQYPDSCAMARNVDHPCTCVHEFAS